MIRSAWRRHSIGALVLACAGLSVGLAAAAEIYKWVDENGVVNYGERPPPNRPSTLVASERARVSVYPAQPPAQSSSPTGDAALRQRVEQLERQLAQQRQEQDYAAQAAADLEAQRLERCRADRLVDCYDEAVGVTYPTVVIFDRPKHFRHRLPFPSRHGTASKPQGVRPLRPQPAEAVR